jgi:periplasmic divalent cation tolerance protein
MSEMIVVFCTCGSEAEAESISTGLVERRLAACVNISPIRSIYRWQGKIESAVEWQLQIKTSESFFDKVSAAIQAAHSYELPEIIAIPIAAGSPAYLQWLGDSLGA